MACTQHRYNVHVHVHCMYACILNANSDCSSYLLAHSGVLNSILAVPVLRSTLSTFPPQLSDRRSSLWLSLATGICLGRPDTMTTRGWVECWTEKDSSACSNCKSPRARMGGTASLYDVYTTINLEIFIVKFS